MSERREALPPKPEEERAVTESTSSGAPKEKKAPKTLFEKLRGMRKAGALALALSELATSTASAETKPAEQAPMIDITRSILADELGDAVLALTGKQAAYGPSSAGKKALRMDARQAGLQEIVKDMVKHLSAADAEGFDAEHDSFTSILSRVGTQGMVYAAYKERFGHLPTGEHDVGYYGAFVKDFMPTGADITDEDIDRRVKDVKRKDLGAEVRGLIEETPGWTKLERTKALRHLADDMGIRRMALDADLTVAEFLSLLKATVVKGESGSNDDALAPETQARIDAKMILEEREKFVRRSILDKDTENLLVFTGRDTKRAAGKAAFRGSDWLEIGRAAGVKEGVMHHFDAQREAPRKTAQAMIDAIVSSRGRTVVAFETHGSRDALSYSADKETDGGVIDVDVLASALVLRAEGSGSAEAIAEVTIVLDSCLSHDFAENLAKRIRAQWKGVRRWRWGRVGKITMPTIVTMAQEGSYGYGGSSVSDVLMHHLRTIEEDGALTGRHLLQDAQSDAYEANDMTFFIPGEDSGIMEISERERPPEDEEPA